MGKSSTKQTVTQTVDAATAARQGEAAFAVRESERLVREAHALDPAHDCQAWVTFALPEAAP